MSSEKRFSLLRNMLRALGLSQEAADDIVNWIVDLLAGEGKDAAAGAANTVEFPYYLRENLLTPAELNFFEVLRDVVGKDAFLCAKVGLGDIFGVKRDDPSRFRIYTNKIDRKHVDFLLCDSITMRPLVGIELDDKSHQRPERQARDSFVDQVFGAAKLPLLHIPARRTYTATELESQLAPYLIGKSKPVVVPQTISKDAPIPPTTMPKPVSVSPKTDIAPRCPKCGGEMILRTAKSGANAGNQFWGCSNYPNCRSMMPYQG